MKIGISDRLWNLLVCPEDLEGRHDRDQRSGLLALRLPHPQLVVLLAVDENEKVLVLALVVDFVRRSPSTSHLDLWLGLLVCGMVCCWAGCGGR